MPTSDIQKKSTVLTTADIRRQFIEYFRDSRDHTAVPSSPVVPHDDPTLLFTNAGMNQFKDVFLGQGERVYSRAVDTQKCIRAGGKHNDLEDVGRDTYHHTFFEMLGNWSFGDYFKEEAIAWAWELLTDVWGLDKERLHVTVFAGDESDGTQPDLEAETIWKKFVPAERITRHGKKDNFWEMGASGPCGPCSEIHYDNSPNGDCGHLVNADDPRVIEIWNLVFMEFNRDDDGALTLLPDKHVDTGMGLERIARILQNVDSNYDTDLWTPIFVAIEQRTGAAPYRGKLDDPVDTAYRVIADHIRCLTVAITDGARPSNEGRGYVLRRILRRAVRVARQTLNVERPLLCELVPAVVESLGEAFPELRDKPKQVAEIIRDEEEAFLRTLDRGLEMFNDAAERADGKMITADDAFKLHDTYGFPIDLTRVMAEERGMTVDEAGYETLMERTREQSRQSSSSDSENRTLTLPPDAIARLKHLDIKPTDDIDKFHAKPITARLMAIWNGADFDEQNISVGKYEMVALIIDRTNFYAEQGGQVGDVGTIVDVDEDRSEFRVHEVRNVGGYVLHVGRLVRGDLSVRESLHLTVDRKHREPVKANHTATHLLNLALREVVGDNVEQKGSLVAPDRLRFDFSAGGGLTSEQLAKVEAIVNARIAESLTVYAELAPLNDAQKITGVRAVFGEKYPDPVRVVSIGQPVAAMLADPDNDEWREYSVEFCGGTHLNDTADAKQFVMLSEGALAAGVRRITALTGPAAMAAQQAGVNMIERIEETEKLEGDALAEQYDDIVAVADDLSIPAPIKVQVAQRLDKLRDRVKKVRKAAQSGAREDAVDAARELAARVSGPVIVEMIDETDKDAISAAMDVVQSKHPDAATMLLAADHDAGKVTILAVSSKPLIAKGLKAGDWVRVTAQACGGGGGGRPDRAQAGGKQPENIKEAAQAAHVYAEQTING